MNQIDKPNMNTIEQHLHGKNPVCRNSLDDALCALRYLVPIPEPGANHQKECKPVRGVYFRGLRGVRASEGGVSWGLDIWRAGLAGVKASCRGLP